MTEKAYISEVTVGAARNAPVQFIRQHNVKKVEAAFELALPGAITRCEDSTALLSILPYARLVINDGKVPRFATVSAEVTDEAGLDHALEKISEKVDFKSVKSFAVRFASDRHSFADIFDAAEKSACCEDCGCGGSGLGGYISIGSATGQSSNKVVWSDPVRTKILVKGGDDHKYGRYDPELMFASLVFDCYSEWWIRGFWKERFTTCHGPCTTANPCNCGKDKRGSRQIACDGWTTCWCF